MDVYLQLLVEENSPHICALLRVSVLNLLSPIIYFTLSVKLLLSCQYDARANGSVVVNDL